MEVVITSPEKDGGGNKTQRRMEVVISKPRAPQTCHLVLLLCGGAGIGALMCFGFPLLQLSVSNYSESPEHGQNICAAQSGAARSQECDSRLTCCLKSPFNYGSALILSPNSANLLRQICISQKNPHLFMHPTHLLASFVRQHFSTHGTGTGIDQYWRPNVPKSTRAQRQCHATV